MTKPKVTRGSLETQVHNSLLRYTKEQPRDRGTAELARVYAREIDDGGDVTKLGPLLLACLEALLLSPRARAAVTKGVVQNETGKPKTLDELRERRARKNGTAAVDSASG